MTEFVLVSFASMIGWELVRYFFPAKIPARIAPLIIIGISYLFTLLINPSILIAFASTAGVAVIHRVIDAESPEPLKINTEFFWVIGDLLKVRNKKSSRIPPLP